MAVKIGHASKDENKNTSGGRPGDSTKEEVCTRDWYPNNWNVLLRPQTSSLAEKSAKACEAGCANCNIGYDMRTDAKDGRNTLNKYAKAVGYDLSKITTPCECDCSSFMHVCAIAGGANLSYGVNGCTTRTIVTDFVNSGDYIKLTDAKYLTSDRYLRRGDILVKEGAHTVMVLENGTLGKSDGGAKPVPGNPGAYVPAVKEWQLAAIADGFEFPQYGADGVWGSECVAVAQKAVVMQRDIYKYMNLTRIVQKAVGVAVDGKCGPATAAAIKKYQEKRGLNPDGACGLNTWKKILKIN